MNNDRKPTADSGSPLLLVKVKKYHYELSAVDLREQYQISLLIIIGNN
jgi:hypothetical protein